VCHGEGGWVAERWEHEITGPDEVTPALPYDKLRTLTPTPTLTLSPTPILTLTLTPTLTLILGDP